jgi:hypothetical protein
VSAAAVDIVETMFGESYFKDHRKIPFADNTTGRRILDISEELCDRSSTLKPHVLHCK